jgi:hypothetical protein
MHADQNINLKALPEFAMLLYETTMLYPIDEEYLKVWAVRSVQCERVPYQFGKLRELPKQEEPKFVFAHFLIPHEPYIFDGNGNCVTEQHKLGKQIKSNYLEQVIYVNNELKRFVETVLSDTIRPAIIMLQADEGPVPQRFESKLRRGRWHQATRKELWQKAGILNAYYFPRGDYESLYDGISPVNSFRVVFNQYFGTDFELLPDEIYAHADDDHVYDFIRVTEPIREQR